jgi:hypothetical protein
METAADITGSADLDRSRTLPPFLTMPGSIGFAYDYETLELMQRVSSAILLDVFGADDKPEECISTVSLGQFPSWRVTAKSSEAYELRRFQGTNSARSTEAGQVSTSQVDARSLALAAPYRDRSRSDALRVISNAPPAGYCCSAPIFDLLNPIAIRKAGAIFDCCSFGLVTRLKSASDYIGASAKTPLFVLPTCIAPYTNSKHCCIQPFAGR